MIPESKLFQIRNVINRHPDLRGCRIGFHGNNRSQVLDFGNPNSTNYDIIIIIEEVEKDLGLKFIAGSGTNVIAEPLKVLNQTVAGTELIKAGVSCIFTVTAGAAVVGSAAAEIPTAGASTVILVAAWTGFITQGIECVNGLSRTVEAYRNPNDNSLERWDSNVWYTRTMSVVDTAGNISDVVGIGAATAGLKRMLTIKGALPGEEALLAMSKKERITAYREAIKKISKSPNAAAEFDNLLTKLGPRVANRMRKDNAVIIRRSAASVSKLISERTVKSVLDATKEVVTSNWAEEQINNIIINIVANR